MKDRIALLRNVAWVAMANYVEAATGLLAGVLIARTLGPADYGLYAFSIWLCGVLVMASNNGLATSSIKFIAEARGAAGEAVAAALLRRFARLQLASSGLVLAVFVIVIVARPILDWRNELWLMVGITVVATWSRAGFWMWSSIGEGYEVFSPANLTLVATALLNVILVCAMSWKGATAEEFFILYAVLGVISNLLLRFLIRRNGIQAGSEPIPKVLEKRLQRHVALTGVMMLILVLTNRSVEMTLLKHYTGNEAVGYFAIAGALTKGAVTLLAGGMAAVLLPAMSRRFGQGGEQGLAGMVVESIRVYWLFGLIIAGLGLTVSGSLIHLLYGASYVGAIEALKWNLVIAGLGAISGAFAAALTVSEQQADRIRIALAALAVNLISGFVLIPVLGLKGAILSLALTHACGVALSWIYCSRQVNFRLPIRPMARQTLAAVVATLLGVAAAQALPLKWAFLSGATAFLLIYLTLCVVLRTFKAAEFDLVAHLVARIGPRAGGIPGRISNLKRFALTD